jgi:hypothetical protein
MTEYIKYCIMKVSILEGIEENEEKLNKSLIIFELKEG